MKNFRILEIVALVALICYLAHTIDANAIDGESDDKKVPSIFDYGNYVEQHKKAYSPMETLRKFKLFLSRTMKIFKHNVLYAAKSAKYFLKQNEFTDMTPEELKEYQGAKSKDTDLKPIRGADKYPNLPASKFKEIKDGKIDVESQASLSDETGDQKLAKTLDEVLGSGKITDAKAMLEAIKSNPDLAKQMATIIEPAGDLNAKKYEEELKAASKDHGVKYQPIVESNNEHYDKTQIRSFGLFDTASWSEKDRQNYAEKMMRGMDIDMIDPFSGSSMVDDDWEDEGYSPITISDLIKGAKFIFNALSTDADLVHPDDVPYNDEKPKNEGVKPAEMGLKYLVDWRKTGCITKPKTQGKCDSCYAFATMAMMEFFHCIETKKLTDFSPQYVVDCGKKSELKGCQGGKITAVGQFIKDFGLELDKIYPYSGNESQCPLDKKSNKKAAGYLKPKINRWVHFADIDAWYKWVTRSPIIVGINMPTDFLSYGGGIHTGVDCVQDMTHAMLLVGTGVENGEKFWLLKNSYGDKWGETGYFRLSHNAPMKCFNAAFVVRTKFNS